MERKRDWIKIALILMLGVVQLPDLKGQDLPQNKYWVYFKDKEVSTNLLLNPSTFLSPRAIERKKRLGVSIDERDLPVRPSYIRKLKDQGLTVPYASKWFNAAMVIADSMQAASLKTLPMVSEVEYLGRHKVKYSNLKSIPRNLSQSPYDPLPDSYGFSGFQIKMIQGHQIHAHGFKGEGIYVAIFDGGFASVDQMPFFDSLRHDSRIFQGKDFVHGDNEIYEASKHGTQVLSVMGSNLPSWFVGSAPEATYFLFKTEDVRSEYKIEEANWVLAAEMADSIGCDLINSSLGYSTFNDPDLNYDYNQMNGRSSLVSRAADMAVEKGIIVVNSAGNEGSSTWRYMGAPADAYDVLAIGAITKYGKKATFSSFGPTSDGRIKPDISVLGQSVAVASSSGYNVVASNGTSFASPLAAGLIACLRQANPDMPNSTFIEHVRRGGHLFNTPSEGLGYGIPNFAQILRNMQPEVAYLSLNPKTQYFSMLRQGKLSVPNIKKETYLIRFFDWSGQLLGQQQAQAKELTGVLRDAQKTYLTMRTFMVLPL